MHLLFIILFIFCLTSCDSVINNKDNMSCVSNVQEKIINGFSMTPMLQHDQKIIFLENYYQCNEIQRGDLVAYDFAGNTHDVIKIVKVLPSDFVDIKDNMLIVNGKQLSNSVGNIYLFSDNEIKMLSTYINNNHIPQDSYFIFGDNISDSVDSRKFGAVHKSNFTGKFKL